MIKILEIKQFTEPTEFRPCLQITLNLDLETIVEGKILINNFEQMVGEEFLKQVERKLNDL